MSTTTDGARAMKRLLLGLVIGPVLLGGLTVGDATAQTPLPPFTVQLELDKSRYLLNEAIQVTLIVDNATDAKVLTSAGFTATPFHLTLRFTRSDGTVIVAPPQGGAGAEGPPPINVDGVQAELIEEVLGTFFDSGIFNALTYYDLSQPDLYRVKAEFQVTVYDEGDRIGQNLAQIGTGTVSTITSLEILFSINADRDGDGFSAPEAVAPFKPLADCNDNNAFVNPDAVEVPGNGLDDDCNPLTPDVVMIPPGTIVVTVRDLAKKPVSGLEVRAFDHDQGECSRQFAEDSPRFLKSVWNSCPTTNIDKTNAFGQATFLLPPGIYLVVTEYKDSKGNLTYAGDTVPNLNSGGTQSRTLTVRTK